MNEFNKCVKQKNKNALIVATVAIVALFLCIATNIATGISKAEAVPDSLQATLDSTSAAYYDALNTQAECQAKVDEAEATIAKCEKEIPEVQSKLCTRAKSMYMNRGFGEILELVIGATSIDELVNNIEYITIVNNKDSALVQSCKDLKAQVESEKVSLEENLAEATTQANIAADAYESAQAALAAAKATEDEEEGSGEGDGPTPGPAPYLGSVVETAKACLGHPYIWGAAGPIGFDCSGLVCFCYGLGGAHTWTTTTFWNQQSGFHRISAGEAVPGDVVSTPSHAGIYVGGGQMIHAPSEGDVVKYSNVQDGMGYFRKG